MNWPKLVILIRHGESIGNTLPTDQWLKLDIPNHEFQLTDKGIEQSRITGEYLHNNYPRGFDAYFTSNYKRAIHTFKIMYPDVPFYKDSRLGELDQGIWSYMTEQEIRLVYPHEVDRRKKQGFYAYRALGGENCPDVELRLKSFITDLQMYWQNKTCLIVGHGQCFKIFQHIIHPFSEEELIAKLNATPFENGSLTIYERTTNKKNKNELKCVRENIVPWKGIL